MFKPVFGEWATRQYLFLWIQQSAEYSYNWLESKGQLDRPVPQYYNNAIVMKRKLPMLTTLPHLIIWLLDTVSLNAIDRFHAR